jgi:hypothetical protein
MVRQIIGLPWLPVTGRLRSSGRGPGSCPQAAGPLSGPAAVTGPAAGHGGRRWPARGRGDGEPGQRAHRERDVPVPAGVLADLVVVERGLVLGCLEGFLDGLITNGKFCCVGRVRLSLSWWHRPLRLRGSVLQSDVALVGEPDDLDLDRLPSAQPASRWRAPVGSGLSAAGALGRTGRSAGADADRRGGA